MYVRIFRWALALVSFLLMIAAAGLFVIYRASQSVPEFYTAALRESPAREDLGAQLEKRVVDLHNQLRHAEHWVAEFTDEQVNGWLAEDLQRKFPTLLPPEIEAPRVAFAPDIARIACRIKTSALTTVLSFDLEASLTEEPNELAIRVAKVRAGRLPVPLTRVLDAVSDAARKADIALRWSQTEGDPVAIVRLNTDDEQLKSGVVIETISIQDGLLQLAGTTLPGDAETIGDTRAMAWLVHSAGPVRP